MRCFNCDCEKPKEGFSQTRNICLIQDPEDLWCDKCIDMEQQLFIEQHDADFDEWCLTVV